jgi:C4-type Zn-finger protein
VTIVQSYHCTACGFRSRPIGVGPFTAARRQVFRYCADCRTVQSLVMRADEPLACVDCGSARLHDIQNACPVCGSNAVGWKTLS